MKEFFNPTPDDDNIEIQYSKHAEKFFAKQHRLSKEEARELLIKAVRHLTKRELNNIDVKFLTGEMQGLYRIRKGNVRIIFSYHNETMIIVTVENIDVRGNVYE